MCGHLAITVLENLRRIAAQKPCPDESENLPDAPSQRLVKLCANKGGDQEIFARPGLNLAPSASEQAILQAIPLVRVDPAAARDYLSTTYDERIAGEMVWVLSDLFESLYSRRIQALRGLTRFIPGR